MAIDNLGFSELFDENECVMYDLPEDFKTTGSNKFFTNPGYTSKTQIKTNILENDDISDEYNCMVFYYPTNKNEKQETKT